MMADKTTPGGVLHDPVNGGRLDEPTAVNLDARLREVSAEAGAALDEARRTRWTVTRDHTLIFAVEAVSDVTVNPERNTLTFKTGA